MKMLFEINERGTFAYRSLDAFGNNVKEQIGSLDKGELVIVLERTNAFHWSGQDGFDLTLSRLGLCYICRFTLKRAS